MDERVAIPTLLNGALGAALLSLLLATGFRDGSQLLWSLSMIIFGLIATYRVAAPRLTAQLYANPWHLHFILQPLTWIAVLVVASTLLAWGNQATWAMVALSYLIGSRFALAADGINRLRREG